MNTCVFAFNWTTLEWFKYFENWEPIAALVYVKNGNF